MLLLDPPTQPSHGGEILLLLQFLNFCYSQQYFSHPCEKPTHPPGNIQIDQNQITTYTLRDVRFVCGIYFVEEWLEISYVTCGGKFRSEISRPKSTHLHVTTFQARCRTGAAVSCEFLLLFQLTRPNPMQPSTPGTTDCEAREDTVHRPNAIRTYRVLWS